MGSSSGVIQSRSERETYFDERDKREVGDQTRKQREKQKGKQEKRDATLLAECALVRDIQRGSQRLDILQNSLLGVKPQHSKKIWEEAIFKTWISFQLITKT